MLMSHHHLSNSNAITSSSLHHNNHFQQQQLSSGTVTSTPASCHLQSPFESLIMAGATSSAAAIAPTVTNHVHHGGSNSTNSSSNNSTSSSSTSTSSSSGSSSGSIKDTTFTKIFVGGLPYHTTDASLREHFQVYGEIEEAVVITDRQTGKSRGYGFVTMSDRLAAERACKDANPIIDGRKANVNLAYLGAKPRGNLQTAGFPLAAALRAGFPTALLPGQYGVGPQLLYPSPYVTPPGLMPLHPPSAAGAAGAAGVSQAAAAAAAAAAVASGFYDYPAAYAATAQFAAANGFDASFPFGGAAAAAAAAGAAANYMGPTFTYASLPPALQNAAAAAAAAASASQAATGLPLSHYAQSQLQEARMQ